TRFSRDWSSDVCSSDLALTSSAEPAQSRTNRAEPPHAAYVQPLRNTGAAGAPSPPPERVAVGLEPSSGTCRSSPSPDSATADADGRKRGAEGCGCGRDV